MNSRLRPTYLKKKVELPALKLYKKKLQWKSSPSGCNCLFSWRDFLCRPDQSVFGASACRLGGSDNAPAQRLCESKGMLTGKAEELLMFSQPVLIHVKHTDHLNHEQNAALFTQRRRCFNRLFGSSGGPDAVVALQSHSK